VTVTALCPDPTQTASARRPAPAPARLYRKQKPMSSADVARAGYQGLHNGRRVVITGLRNKLLVQSARMSPRRVVTMVGRRLWESA
jgi:short-subunit dehydrogenase